MRVAIIQSNYIPWRGYFDIINQVDLFIFHDDIQYTKGDWRNRNYFKTPNGPKLVTVPVKYNKSQQLIEETYIDNSQQWKKKHLNIFINSYQKAEYFKDALRILEECFSKDLKTISELNRYAVELICNYLSINTPKILSSEYNESGIKTDKVINLIKRAGGTIYLTGKNAVAYLENDKFKFNKIGLEYKTYKYKEYPQLWGEFIGEVSILDLIANCGPESYNYIKAIQDNIKVI